MKFVTKNEIIDITDSVEKEYLECWSIFKNFRKSNFNIDSLFSFQPKLANAIYKEEKLYYKICEEEKYLIKNKHRYKIKWFKQRMSKLKQYKEFINKVISIGKCIGDGFIYIFYHNDIDLIKKHNKNPRVSHMAKGLGTKGELTFINNTSIISGYIVLYHGICNYLNIGDISLYSPESDRIVAVGELKSKQEFNKLEIAVDFISKINFSEDPIIHAPTGKPTELKINKEIEGHKNFDNIIRERLEKQIENMKTIFENDTKTVKKLDSRVSKYYYKDLEEVCKKAEKTNIYVKKICNSLVISCFTNYNKKLSQLLFKDSKNFDKDLTKHFDLKKISQIVIKNSDYNKITLCELPLICHYSDVPLSMWNVNLNILKDIIFQRKNIFIVFNPAYITESLIKKGYTYEEEKDKSISLCKKFSNNRVIKIHNIYFYFGLIAHHLMNEENVLTMIQDMEDVILSSNLKGKAKIDFDLVQRA